jgi:hypothetical protein
MAMFRYPAAACPEPPQQLGKAFGFMCQALGSRRGLLDHRGVLLRHLIHLVAGSRDLAQTCRLLAGGNGDLGHGRIHGSDLLNYLFERDAGFTHQLDAGLDLRRGCRDQLLDLPCRVGGALGELADFLGDDGKTCLVGIIARPIGGLPLKSLFL